MKRIIFSTIAALALSACVTTVEETDPTAMKTEMVCAVENPDGTCACEVVDENGDCVEGGGPGVIGQGGSQVAVPASSIERVEENSNVTGGGPGTIGQGGVPE